MAWTPARLFGCIVWPKRPQSLGAMASIDFLITGRGTAGVIQGESRCDEGDADGVNAYIDPTLVGDAEAQVECQSEEQTPGRGSSLATCERGVVESRPRVVDEQAFDPITEFTVFTDHFATKSNQASAGDDEDGVSEHLKMKTIILWNVEGAIGRLKRQKSAP